MTIHVICLVWSKYKRATSPMFLNRCGHDYPQATMEPADGSFLGFVNNVCSYTLPPSQKHRTELVKLPRP